MNAKTIVWWIVIRPEFYKQLARANPFYKWLGRVFLFIAFTPLALMLLESYGVLVIPTWIQISLWVLIIFIFVVLAAHLNFKNKQWDRHRQGCCYSCGYDLREEVESGQMVLCPGCGKENLFDPHNPEDERQKESF